MSLSSEHPAVAPDATGRVCADARCATLLPADAEICDECGGMRFEPLERIDVLLCGWADTRPVVFAVHAERPSIVGRSSPGGPMPDIDLRRFPDSGFVHRRHASIELNDGQWQVTHLGTNPLVVTGNGVLQLEPGATATLRSGTTLQVGEVILQFVERASARRI